MITLPSLLNPSGYGSMNMVLSAPASDEMTLLAILILPNLALPPSEIKSPPTNTFFSTPIPPSKITLPVSFVVASVVLLNLVPDPPISNLSTPASSYLMNASTEPVPFAPPPKPNLLSSGMTTSPVPFG